MAELIRGRAGRVIGHWTGFMSMMKGLPLGYNRDQQEDKPPLFNAMQVCEESLVLIREMLATATWHLDKMRQAAGTGFSTATGLAEALVGQGVPFRVAHELVGAWVRHGGQGVPAGADPLVAATLERFDPSVEASLADKQTAGGPGPEAMAEQIALARQAIAVAPVVEYNWRQA
jgi:argininosuccinate lyase